MNFNVKIILISVLLTMASCVPLSLTTDPFNAMVKITDKLYVDQTEITVGSWLSYYTWTLENAGKPAADSLLPDREYLTEYVWKYINTKPLVESSFEAPHTREKLGFFLDECDEIKNKDSLNTKFDPNFKRKKCDYLDFPITGISYKQAVGFCKWRTERNGTGKIVYRLPTEKEWEDIAWMGLTAIEKQGGLQDSIVKETMFQTYNYKCFPQSGNAAQMGKDTSYIKRRALLIGSTLNIFDLFGNVSEMVDTEGVSKGGNYDTYAIQCRIDTMIGYTKPEKWLGFRCVAEIN